MSTEGIPPPFQGVTHVDGGGADSFTGTDSYHRPAARPNILRRFWSRWKKPTLRVETLACSSASWWKEGRALEGSVRLSSTALETSQPGGWSVRCGVRYLEEQYWLEPVAPFRLTHNGAPLTQPTALASGDVVTTDGLTVRLLVGEAPPALTALTAAEAYAGELRVGMLSVVEGPDFRRARLRWRTHGAGSLTSFSRTALANSLTSLELILRPSDGEAGVDLETVSRLAGELGEHLLPKTQFVLPNALDAPRSLQLRVSAPVDVRFDGDLIALEQAQDVGARLVGAPQGLRVEASFAPAPVILRLGQGTFLSCEDGWGDLDNISRPGATMAITAANSGFLLPLLEGDEWLLSSKATPERPATVHRLTVHPRLTRRRAQPTAALPVTPAEPEPLMFEGQAHRRVTLQLSSHDVDFTQGSDGLFRGPEAAVFGVVGPGRLKRPRGEGTGFGFYDVLELEHGRWALALPSPSGFLRGRTRFPRGPLTREALAVFVDALLEEGDGAGPALRSLLEAKGERQQASAFSRLLLRPINRHKLQRWLRAQGDALSRFDEVTRVTSFEDARYLLDDALRTEPVFQRVRQVHVDVTPQLGDGGKAEYWLRLTRTGGWIPSVEVVCWRGGQVVERFVPGELNSTVDVAPAKRG